jgi:nitrate/TMAO reductase-like tetraheme cytochrome c subunit
MIDDAGVIGRRAALSLWVVLLGLVVIFGGFVGAARATDRSPFCKSCHEMEPYYKEWLAGPHAQKAECIDCHVDPGFGPRMTHKFVALNEVYQHVLGNRLFPLAEPPVVPNSRCQRCHPSVQSKRKNFSHDLHASKATCQQCHSTTGHDVTAADLKAAGVYNASVEVTRPAFEVATVNGGNANIPGHVTVVCSRCHDMAKTGCAACHTPPKEHPAQAAGKSCSLCHAAGAKFAFRHPPASASCAECHKAPARHPANAQGKACVVCHRKAGGSWKFTHPGLKADCQTCHQPPAKHSGPPCVSCHRKPGVTWAFSHPGAGEHSATSFPCVKCHPSGPPRVYCTCHKGNPPRD